MNTETKQQILGVLGYEEGKLPIRYLGLPLISAKLSKSDCLQVIDKIVGEIEGICRNFLWCGNIDTRSMSLIAWDKLCVPKSEGGRGIKQISTWNKSTKGKQLWKIISRQKCLLD